MNIIQTIKKYAAPLAVLVLALGFTAGVLAQQSTNSGVQPFWDGSELETRYGGILFSDRNLSTSDDAITNTNAALSGTSLSDIRIYADTGKLTAFNNLTTRGDMAVLSGGYARFGSAYPNTIATATVNGNVTATKLADPQTLGLRGLCADENGVIYPCVAPEDVVEVPDVAPVVEYSWQEGNYGQCSTVTGQKTRTVRCVGSDGNSYNDSACLPTPKPATTTTDGCNAANFVKYCGFQPVPGLEASCSPLSERGIDNDPDCYQFSHCYYSDGTTKEVGQDGCSDILIPSDATDPTATTMEAAPYCQTQAVNDLDLNDFSATEPGCYPAYGEGDPNYFANCFNYDRKELCESVCRIQENSQGGSTFGDASDSYGICQKRAVQSISSDPREYSFSNEIGGITTETKTCTWVAPDAGLGT